MRSTNTFGNSKVWPTSTLPGIIDRASSALNHAESMFHVFNGAASGVALRCRSRAKPVKTSPSLGTRRSQRCSCPNRKPSVWPTAHALRKPIPSFPAQFQRLKHPVRIEMIDRCQKFSIGGTDVDALPRFVSPTDTGVSGLGHLLEKTAVVIVSIVKSPHFVSRRNEVFGEGDNPFVGPDRPPAFHTVVSCTAKRVSIHRPQQNRLASLGRLHDSGLPGLAASQFDSTAIRTVPVECVSSMRCSCRGSTQVVVVLSKRKQKGSNCRLTLLSDVSSSRLPQLQKRVGRAGRDYPGRPRRQSIDSLLNESVG